MMRNEPRRLMAETIDTRLRREAGGYRPRVGREVEMRWHRALVEAKAPRTQETRRGMPWRWAMAAVAAAVVVLAVTKPWEAVQKPQAVVPVPQQQPMAGPIAPAGAIADMGELMQSPMSREMDALQNDAQRMLRTMVWFEGSEAAPPAKTGT